MPREPFKFLNTGEFELLTLSEKVSYVQRAFEAIRKWRGRAKPRLERRKKKRK